VAIKSKFSESEIIGAIGELEGGATQTDIARRMGVSTQTMQRWRAKYGRMTVSEAQDKGAWRTRIASYAAWWRSTPWSSSR
jgi:transposase-like protein